MKHRRIRINNPWFIYMNMNITDLVVLAVIILALDAVFLYTAKDLFARQVMLVQGTAMKVNIPSAAVCYFLIVVGLYYFVLRHIIVPNATSTAAAIQTMRLGDGIKAAFFLGVLVYGVYETTTLAILRNWSPMTAVIDTTWGGTLFALSAYLFYKYKTLVY
jgi:uncharacterized membrane protein